MKKIYQTPLVEQVDYSLQNFLAQSTDGSLTDMPGEVIFDDDLVG